MATTKKKSKKSLSENTCVFCEKSFRSEKTLSVHMCMRKRRYADKDLKGNRLGFRTFQRFYELSVMSKTPKTIDDFIRSSYYIAFVKFGNYVSSINPLYPDQFIDFLIRNGVSLDDWTKDSVYETYLRDLTRKETPDRALERNILLMKQWADENEEHWADFFKKINTNLAVHWIKSGRISPWVLYAADSAEDLFCRFNPEQINMIETYIDPNFWKVRIMRHKDDIEFVTTVLKGSGL